MRVSVYYTDGRIQTWNDWHDNAEIPPDETYVFFNVPTYGAVKIVLTYENGTLQLEDFKHSGERFLYMPVNRDGKLKVTQYVNGAPVVNRIGPGMSISNSTANGTVQFASRYEDNQSILQALQSKMPYGALTYR